MVETHYSATLVPEHCQGLPCKYVHNEGDSLSHDDVVVDDDDDDDSDGGGGDDDYDDYDDDNDDDDDVDV